jgi:hypothetical protein
MPVTEREIRDRAADILSQPDSWCQSTPRRQRPDGGYQYCILGACREAAGYYDAAWDVACAAAAAAWDVALAAVPAVARAVAATDWNDAPGRTVDEVIAALRAVP